MTNAPPFDASRATGPILRLPAAEVVDLLPVVHAPEKVAEYRAAFQRGETFPPLGVVRLFGRVVLADGHKRLAAFRAVGGADVVVEVWTGRRWLADQLRQLRDNARKNARIARLLLSDRREALRLLRATTGHWHRVAVSLARILVPRRRAPD